MKLRKTIAVKILLALLITGLFPLFFGSGIDRVLQQAAKSDSKVISKGVPALTTPWKMFHSVLTKWGLVLEDQTYQHARYSDGIVTLIEIDDRALEEIGPYNTWNRSVLTEVINKLNVSDVIRPAVIGVDVIFSGESDPVLDQNLAEAAGQYGNVVVASAVEFGTKLEKREDGSRYLKSNAVLEYSPPYALLEESAMVGYVNAAMDDDGILRHHRLDTEIEGETVPSFAKKIAEVYAETMEGRELDLPKNKYWYLPFFGKQGTYSESISVVSILNGEIPPEYFAGRIVLIGVYAAGLQDSYVTSIDHAGSCYGVEVQANAIEALLQGKYKYEAEEKLQMFLLWAILLVGVLVFSRRKEILSFAAWAVLLIGWIFFCVQMEKRGMLFHILWVPAALTMVYIGFIAYNAFHSLKEKKQITNMFSHYVAPEIVKELIKVGPQGLQLGGKVARIAVLFVDVRGFTTMSEALDPVEVVAILNEYLTLITDCVLKNHGTLDKFVGDCAMAVWGSPLPQEDSVWHAVNAAIDMVEGSRELSQRLMEKYGRSVDFGIGVNVGDAVVGNMGSAIHMDYTAIGDTVNTAARLEANAPAGHVYISRAVAEELGDRIQSISLGGTIRLKGKAEGFEVLDLIIPTGKGNGQS